MRFLNIILTVSLCVATVFGDYIVFESKYSKSQVFRALADTSVHGVLGLLSSLLFFSYGINIATEARLYNVLFCVAISSLIDVDHMIVAKSFYMKDILLNNRRGIFHNTSFWIILTTILLVASHLTRRNNVYLLTYMIILAFTSHHVRDGNRRGLWFYPYGHTHALGKHVYILMISVMPSFFAYAYNYTKPVSKHNIVQYSVLLI